MKKKLSGIALFIWGANLLGLLTLGIFLAVSGFFYAPGSAAPQNSPPPRRTNRPSRTPFPNVTLRPSLTPWPTPSMGPSVTPLAVSANRQIIGYSVENRPLEVYRYGTGASVKLIVAGIHGGYEHNTVELAAEFIAYLNDHPQAIPADTSLYILPAINPDGYARGAGVDGRANNHNVDLNRNWPYNWKKDWVRDGCWLYTPIEGGATAASEPEVQALIAFVDLIRPQALISYHSAALGIFPGGRPDFPASLRLAEDLAAVSDYPYPPIDTGCDYTGNLTDWAANTRNIAAVDIELTNHRETDFAQNLRILQVFLSWR